MQNLHKYAPTFLRLVLVVILLFAGINKLARDPQSFVEQVKQMDILPGTLALVYGYTLPYLEITLAVLLLVGLFTRVVAIITALTFLSIIVGVGVASIKGGIPLCMDPYIQMLPNKDFGFLACAVALALLGSGAFALDNKLKCNSCLIN